MLGEILLEATMHQREKQKKAERMVTRVSPFCVPTSEQAFVLKIGLTPKSLFE